MKNHSIIYLLLFMLFGSLSVQSQTVFRGTVIDATTKQPISKARVGINNQGVGEITNTKGFFNYKKYHEVLNSESELVVGANGYETIRLDAEKVRTLFNRSSKIELQPVSKKKKKLQVKDLTVFWDVSEEMQGRNVEAEIAYVQSYVSSYKEVTLRLVVFDYEVRSEEFITIRNGDITRFRESVNSLIYNGPSNYDVLDIAAADAVILSSNGNPNYGTFQVSQEVPVYAISSEAVAVELDYVHSLASYTQGRYTLLRESGKTTPNSNIAVQKVTGPKIKGKVTSLGKPLQEVSVVKKGDFTEYLTKADGSFELPASDGDVLQFRYLGMFPKVVLVENTDAINIELVPRNDVLDEIVLTAKYEEIIVGNKVIRGTNEPFMPGGITKLGDFYITHKDITPNGRTLEMVLREKFNGVVVSYTPEGEVVTIFGDRPLWIVNGFALQAGEPIPLYIADSDIASIIIKDSDMTNIKYGGQGQVGLQVIVTTKAGREEFKGGKEYLVKNNDFNETLEDINSSSVINSKTQITGKVTSLGKPIQGATITKKGTFEEYTSKADGSFKVFANEGEILAVNYLGMYTKLIIIDDNIKEIEIDLLPESDVLDEVEISGKAKESVKRGADIEAGRYKDPFLGSFDVQTITREDTNIDGWANVAFGLQGKFSSVQVDTKPGFESVSIRNDAAAYYINGNPVKDIEFFAVSPTNIATVSVKKNIVGIIGRAIFIDTIDFISKDKPVPSALVEGNDYAGEELKSLSDPLLTSSSKVLVTGVVRSPKGFLADATITRKGSFDEVYTDTKGAFAIKASLGDVLVVSKVGMFTKEVLIESQDVGSIELTPKNDELDEVIVSGGKRVDNTIEGNDGRRVDKDKLGYAASELTENDFSAGATNLQQLITGKVSGVSVEGGLYSGSQVVYKIRGGNQSIENEIPPIWIVNGIPYPDPPNFLDVQQIASITVLKSVIATSRYGTLAAGGAFLIKTKEVSFQDKAKKAQQSALVSGNEYTESSTRTLDTSTLPEYILRLREIPNLQDQFETYQRISRTQESPLEFYVDVAQYFDGINKDMADQVRADLAYISRNNTKALRTLCYIYEASGDYEKAALVYERILKVAPSEAQSYRDLALAYQEIGKYNEALELYYNMLGEQIKGVDFSGLEKTLRNELSHLLALHKDQVDYDRFPNEWLRTDFDIDIRMVIDWSDRSVPFEFQFVNPEKKFFKWTHTLEDSRARLEDEQAQGYQSEEFIIDDAPSGEWLINIQYLGDEGDYVLPPFLKYTVYRNYGTPQETKEIKVVKLFKQSDKVTLGRVTL